MAGTQGRGAQGSKLLDLKGFLLDSCLGGLWWGWISHRAHPVRAKAMWLFGIFFLHASVAQGMQIPMGVQILDLQKRLCDEREQFTEVTSWQHLCRQGLWPTIGPKAWKGKNGDGAPLKESISLGGSKSLSEALMMARDGTWRKMWLSAVARVFHGETHKT